MSSLQNMNEIAALVPEVNMISDKSLVELNLQKIPSSFWEIPSSTTGKYHPSDEFTDGGLVLHTRRSMQVASTLCEAFDIIGAERDKILIALFFHDHGKNGSFYNQTLHINKAVETYELPADIKSMIRHHEGKWTPYSVRDDGDDNTFDRKTLDNWPVLHKIVHLADFIAARRNIVIQV